MLSIANVMNAEHAKSYFTKEDYYLTKDKDAAAQWWGSGAKELGLEGRVDKEVFGKLLRGELPDGTQLPSKKGGERRAATDLTFSAPKTVSIEALVHDRPDVISAHTAAVKTALDYLEKHAATVRTSSDGKYHRHSSNTLAVAMFEHHASRALDPQLHTHCLALNATKTSDGKWRALVNDDLYTHKMAAGMVYRAELSRGLKELGYELRQTHADGRFEIANYRDEQIQSFSKRRQEIVAALGGELGEKLRDMGIEGAEAAKKANLGTRQIKREVDPEALRALWREEGKQARVEPAERRQSRPGWMEDGATTKAASEAVQWAIDHLSERRAVWNERDVLKAALSRHLTDVTLADIETCLAKMKTDGELVVVERRREGQEIFTTRSMLELEARAVELMKSGRERCDSICLTNVVDDSLEAYGMTFGQARAAHLILLNRDMVVGVQGYAGTGKTTMLRAVRDLAQEAGYTVRGMGVSGTAAKELQEGAGIQSSTVASHLHRHRTTGSAKRELWLVDEASFLCSRDAVRLLEAAKSSGARMVLLGDRDQLPAIEAGQPFAQLCKRGMRTAIMSEIVRTKNDKLKQAVYQTIDKKKLSEEKAVAAAKDIVRALSKSVIVEESADARHQAVAQAYLDSDRETTLVVTASHKQRCDISERIRNGLVEDGTLGKRPAEAKVLVNRDLTVAQLRCAGTYEQGDIVRVGRRGGYKSLGLAEGAYATVQGRDDTHRVLLETENGRVVAWDPTKAHRVEVYRHESRALRVGDKIRWNRTDKNLSRLNGTTAHVLSIRSEAPEAIVRMADGSRQVLDLDREKHWDHGYVCTNNAAQGATCAKVIAHINTRETLVGHESWYVAISRAQLNALIFTDNVSKLPEAITHDMSQPSAVEKLEEYEQFMRDIERQAKEARVVPSWQRDAIEAFRHGKAGDGLHILRERGWVCEHREAWRAFESVYERWKEQNEKGRSAQSVMLASTKREIATLNAMARDELRTSGLLGEDQIVKTRAGERELAAGDLVRFCRAMPELNVCRGQVATVRDVTTGSDAEGGTRLRLDANGRELNVRLSDFDDFDYAYAATYRRGASIKADHVFVLASPALDKKTALAAVDRDAERVELHWSRASFASEQGLAVAMSRGPTEKIPLEYLGRHQLLRERGRCEAAFMQAQSDAVVADNAKTKAEKEADRTRAQAELEKVRLLYDMSRKNEPWMRQATHDVAIGKVTDGLDAYAQKGLVCSHEYDTLALVQLHENWQEAAVLRPTEISVMIAHRGKDVAELNTWARETMRSFDELVGEDRTLPTANGPRTMAVGERVVFGRSNAELGIKSGHFGTVKAIDGDKLSVRVPGRLIEIDLKRHGHIDYAYAMSPWQASRLVADNVYVLATEHLDRDASRTALSRHSKHLEVHWSTQTFESQEAMKEALGRNKGEPLRDELLGVVALRRRLWRCTYLAKETPVPGMPKKQLDEITQARRELPALRRLVDAKNREVVRGNATSLAQKTKQEQSIEREAS